MSQSYLQSAVHTGHGEVEILSIFSGKAVDKSRIVECSFDDVGYVQGVNLIINPSSEGVERFAMFVPHQDVVDWSWRWNLHVRVS